MKYLSLSFFFLLFANCKLIAQLKLGYVEANSYVGINVFSYKNNPLILSRHKGTTDLEGDMYANLQVFFKTKTDGLFLGTGLGYAQKRTGMSKYKPIDYLLLSLAGRDTQHIKQVEIQSKYLSLPFSLSVCLTKKLQRAVKFYGGLRLINNFKTNSSATVTVDSSFFIPTLSQQNELNEKYKSTTISYFAKLQAELTVDISFGGDVGLRLGMIPMQKDFVNYSTNFTTGSIGTGFIATIYYKPIKKQ